MSLKTENIPVVGKIQSTFKNSKTARNVALMSAAAGGIAFVSSKAPKYIADKVKFSTRLGKAAGMSLLTAGIASAFVILKKNGIIDKAVSKVQGLFNNDKTNKTEADKDSSKTESEVAIKETAQETKAASEDTETEANTSEEKIKE